MLTTSGISLEGGSGDLAFSAQVTVDDFSGAVSLVVVTFVVSLAACFTDSNGIIPQGVLFSALSGKNLNLLRCTFVGRIMWPYETY